MCNKTLPQIHSEFTELSMPQLSPKLFVAYRTFLKISENMCNKTLAQIHSNPLSSALYNALANTKLLKPSSITRPISEL
jgi:hypothetical protein